MLIDIDPEFRALIPPPSEEERATLEKNMQFDGLLDPLRVWDQGDGRAILLDGHTRKSICDKHRIPYKVVPIPVQTRAEARAWIIRHQLGRRNLPPYRRAELALMLEGIIAERARANQGTRTDLVSNETKEKMEAQHVDTLGEVAEAAGVSRATLARAKVIHEEGDEEAKERLRQGQSSIHKEYTRIRPPAPEAPESSKKTAPSLLALCSEWIEQAIQRGDLPDDMVASGHTLLYRIQRHTP